MLGFRDSGYDERFEKTQLSPDKHNLDAEALATFKKALHKSHGRTNNSLASLLAQAGATVDEVIKLASDKFLPAYESGNRKFLAKPANQTDRRILGESGHGYGLTTGLAKSMFKRIPNWYDTMEARHDPIMTEVMRKFMTDEGWRIVSDYGKSGLGDFLTEFLPITAIDEEGRYAEWLRAMLSTNFGWGWGSLDCAGRFSAYVPCRYACKFYCYLSTMMKHLSDEAKNEFGVGKLYGVATMGFIVSTYDRGDYKHDNERFELGKHRAYEVESIVNSEHDETSDKFLFTDELYGAIIGYMQDEKDVKEIELKLLWDEFYHCCSEMGIVVYVRKNRVSELTLGRARSIMKKIVRLYDVYRKLVDKQGFVMSVARGTVVGEMNSWLTNVCYKCYAPIAAAARTDIEDLPPVEKKKRTRKQPEVKVYYESLDEFFAELNGEEE